MPEIIYYVAASLDAYIATPDGGVEWLAPFETVGEDYGYAAFYTSVEAILLGSRTYEQLLTWSAWPYPGKPCWVFSHRQLDIVQPEVTLTNHSPAQIMRTLQASDVRRAWLVGGGALAASFRALSLITEYIVSIIPVLLGSGLPLFALPGPREQLHLVGSTSYANGVVQLRYLPGREA
jgi:dihydrofolate reductase